METFRFKSQDNQCMPSYSNFNRRLLGNLKQVEIKQSYYHSIFKSKSLFGLKEKLQKDKNPSSFIPHLINQNISQKKQSKSAYEAFQLQKNNQMTSRPIKFRNTASLTNWFSAEKIDQSQKKPKKIELLMMEKKQNFSLTMRRNFSKLNQSYKNSIKNTQKEDMAMYNQHRLSEQQSMKIQMETKSKKSIVFKGVSGFAEKKFSQKYHHDDIFVKENNLFSISIESRKCMDGIFPMFRSGHTLCSIGISVFLFGGINSKLANGYHFNEFLGSLREWICIKNQQNLNVIIPSFHTVQTFRNSLIFIGGSTINQKSIKRLYNRDILVYDTDKEWFSKIKWNISIRSHASTIYSNMIVIYGGINENNEFSNILYFLPLNTSNISQTNPIPYNLGAQGQGIAFHKMVNTFEIDGHLKSKLQIDGIICYGGKFADETLNDEVLLFRFNKNKQSTQTQQIIKGWQTLKTHGIKPQSRCCHSMDILYKKCICLVIGGMNFGGQALNDAWILDLTTSTWVKAIFDSRYEILERGIFSHATTVMNGQVYVFGGLNGQNKISNEFWSVDFTFNRAAKKQEYLKKSRCQIASSPKITHKISKNKIL